MTTSVAHDSAQIHFRNTQAEAHPFCFVCSGSNPMGLALRYAPQPDGSVSASFLGHSALEGYPGLLHGGVIAALKQRDIRCLAPAHCTGRAVVPAMQQRFSGRCARCDAGSLHVFRR
jgi:hypothetical protein